MRYVDVRRRWVAYLSIPDGISFKVFGATMVQFTDQPNIFIVPTAHNPSGLQGYNIYHPTNLRIAHPSYCPLFFSFFSLSASFRVPNPRDRIFSFPSFAWLASSLNRFRTPLRHLLLTHTLIVPRTQFRNRSSPKSDKFYCKPVSINSPFFSTSYIFFVYFFLVCWDRVCVLGDLPNCI